MIEYKDDLAVFERLAPVINVFFSALLSAPVLERLVFHEKSLYWGFSKTPVLEEIDFFGKFPYRENNFPVCGPCAVVCEYFEFFQSSPVCGPCVVVCGDFEFFSKFPCVWALCCGV